MKKEKNLILSQFTMATIQVFYTSTKSSSKDGALATKSFNS